MVALDIKNLSVWFGRIEALKKVTLTIQANEILSIIGPSNSGKTTFLRMLNRLNEIHPGFRMDGEITIDGADLLQIDVEVLRKRIGMVFALPLSLPLSIYDNVAYGVRMHGEKNKKKLEQRVQTALMDAYLWDEVKDRLEESAFKLSGGQQQRLCIARTLAVEPDVILFDEPCSGLDPISTAKVEDAMLKLKSRYTIVLVTNNVKQAARVGDRTAFFLSGELIELDTTEKIFTTPCDQRTEEYLQGKFG